MVKTMCDTKEFINELIDSNNIDSKKFFPVWKDETKEKQALKQFNFNKRVAYCPECDIMLEYGGYASHLSTLGGRLMGSRGHTLWCPKCGYRFYVATEYLD
jgi:Zn finger protein HypA/HybF involved in hydrogenase expression